MSKRLTYLIVTILFMLPAGKLTAQQDAMFSQYMFNGLIINPAYAGSWGVMSNRFLVRKQWVGFDGAPETFTFSTHFATPDKQNGFGLVLMHDKLGITHQNFGSINYAFRREFEGIEFALGISGNLSNYQVRWQEIRTTVADDPSFGGSTRNVTLPNAGAGVFVKSDKFFAGFSVPVLLNQDLKFNVNSTGPNGMTSSHLRHYFLTGGLALPIGDQVIYKPSFLMKYVSNAPMQIDLNSSFLIKETFWTGVSYRWDNAIVFIFEYIHNNNIRFGYSYDVSVNGTQDFHSGTHEFMLGIDLDFQDSGFEDPRLF